MTGALPFPLHGVLKERPNTVLAEFPCAVWPVRGRRDDGGMHYDHQGEAPLVHWPLLRQANRVLEVDGEEYVVVHAERHAYVPHVSLNLRRTRSTGT